MESSEAHKIHQIQLDRDAAEQFPSFEAKQKSEKPSLTYFSPKVEKRKSTIDGRGRGKASARARSSW